MVESINLFDLTRERMEAFTSEVDDKPYRTHQIMKWAYHQRSLDFASMTNLSKQFRGWLESACRIQTCLKWLPGTNPSMAQSNG